MIELWGRYMLDMIDFSTVGEVTWDPEGSKLVAAFEGVLPITNGGVGVVAPTLYIYILTHPGGRDYGRYYQCAVVAANEDDAREVHPSGDNSKWADDSWVLPSESHLLGVKMVGIADGEVTGTVLMRDYVPPALFSLEYLHSMNP